MKADILIAGAGHGGLSAAYHLAKNGMDVLIIEKNKRSVLGWEQEDSVSVDSFYKADIPVPLTHIIKKMPITICCGDASVPELSEVVPDNGCTVMIDRRELCKYLIQLAEDAGVNILFDTEIESPIVVGSRVIGVKTSRGEFYGSLVVDACGLHSPLRTQLPPCFGIQKEPGEYEVLHTYRAEYALVHKALLPEHPYRVYVIRDGNIGIQWVVTRSGFADVLVGRFCPYDTDEAMKCIEEMRTDSPQLSDSLLRGGHVADIPVRQPLSMLVADGYAAIGDSAFMTYSVTGSGVGYAMRAGKILAECILQTEQPLYTKEELWKYQVRFFAEIGNSASVFALAKNLLTYIRASEVRYLLQEELLNEKVMAAIATENGVMELITDSGISRIRNKLLRFFDNRELRKKILHITVWFARLAPILNALPDKYDPEDIAKWCEKYDSFFESIKPGTEEELTETPTEPPNADNEQ